jgi:hypothetical protein
MQTTQSSPLKTLEAAEEAYHQLRPNWDALKIRSQTTLDQIKDRLKKIEEPHWDWDDYLTSHIADKLQKMQAIIGSMIEYHLVEIQKLVPTVDKQMDYVPKLRAICKREVDKEREKLLDAQRKKTHLTEEELNKACQKIELLCDEVLENEPKWINNLAKYLAHTPLLEHFTDCGETALAKNHTQLEKIEEKLSSFIHPYIPEEKSNQE